MSAKSRSELSESAVIAWASLLRSSQRLLMIVESELKQENLPALSWYDVLLELRREGSRGMRPFELQKRLLLAQYNLSRLLDRMNKDGVIEKVHCDEDGRGQVLRITSSGKSLMRKMWPVYRSSIIDHFSAHLDERDITELRNVLLRLEGNHDGS